MVMDREENYTPSFDCSPLELHHLHQQQQQHQHHRHLMKPQSNINDNSNGTIHYMLNNNHHQQQDQHQQQQLSPGFCTTTSSTSFDKLSFADVMQFADFGPKLALNQTKIPEEEPGIDPVCFLKFPVLNDKLEDHSLNNMVPHQPGGNHDHQETFKGVLMRSENRTGGGPEEKRGTTREEIDEARVSDNCNSAQQVLRFLGEDIQNKNPTNEGKNKRKRPRTIKSSEEVESQRMTHIAVERNRRKQMNEHLRVLRSLMPGSYVQRGDQASIIGGAIEFVRELEQLLQCLESQKRRRLLGEAQRQMGDSSMAIGQLPQTPLIFPPLPLPNDQMKLVEFETGLHEETAEKKSCLADVEVKLLGFDAMIKILSRRRPGQLIKTIAVLEDLQLNILHTNVTTIEQTVLYSFNVKVASETRFTAEDIASSVQQIFSFIHANSSM